jgi:molybdate transport system substrate-binding protein
MFVKTHREDAMMDLLGQWSRWRGAIAAVTAILFTCTAVCAHAGEIKVAVAANFTDPVKEIGAQFEKATGHKLSLSFGATGQFYAQIAQGAPFEILISADQATPAKAVSEGYAVAGTAFTYAVGKLVLYSKTNDLKLGEATLKDGNFAKIAIANPAIAPYGAAAVETMKALGVYDTLQPKIVQGNNIAQTFQFIDTGNAEVGFVALSQVAFVVGGSRWIVPAKLHAPIAQDTVLLKAGAGNEAARAFLAYLTGPEARVVIAKFGYGVGE